MRIDIAATLLQAIEGGCTPQRLYKLTASTVPDHAQLVECADEKTGVRFGNAKRRQGRAVKIGSGGRNKTSDHAYQIWAVW